MSGLKIDATKQDVFCLPRPSGGLKAFPTDLFSNLSQHISHEVLIAPYSTTASCHHKLPQGLALGQGQLARTASGHPPRCLTHFDVAVLQHHIPNYDN